MSEKEQGGSTTLPRSFQEGRWPPLMVGGQRGTLPWFASVAPLPFDSCRVHVRVRYGGSLHWGKSLNPRGD
jgi:hypothetical protein